MQLSGIPTKFPVVWAAGQTATYVRPVPVTYTGAEVGAASFTLGFPAATFIPLASGGAPPDGRDTNGILQEITEWNQWQQAGGPIQYDSSFQASIGGYPQGAIVQSIATFGKSWLSTVDNNTTNPDTGGAGWEIYPQYLPATGVAAGTYTLLSGTVGADGRITSASSTTSINISGSIVSGTEVYAPILATTGTGYIGVGSGASTFGGTITASGGIYANGGVTTTNVVASGVVNATGGGTLGGVTLGDSYVTAGNGANFGGGTVTAGVVNSTGGGTLGGVNISGNNVSAPGYGNFSGGLNVVGTYPGLGYTFYVNGNSYHAGAATFASSGTFIGSVTANDGLTVNGSTLVASDNAAIYGNLTIVGNTAAEWQCNAYGAGNPAMICSVGLVAGTYGFNAITGYYLGPAGVAAYGTFSGQFAFSSGEGNLQGLAFYATSDVRLKENFAPITAEDGMAFVRAAKPTAFDWKADGSHGTGYVAQQLLAAGFPHLVSAVYDENVEEETHEFDGVSVTSMKTVRMIAKYDDMIALLHAALIGALDRADAAESRLTALEARLGAP
jgi:hypothetical protein